MESLASWTRFDKLKRSAGIHRFVVFCPGAMVCDMVFFGKFWEIQFTVTCVDFCCFNKDFPDDFGETSLFNLFSMIYKKLSSRSN